MNGSQQNTYGRDPQPAMATGPEGTPASPSATPGYPGPAAPPPAAGYPPPASAPRPPDPRAKSPALACILSVIPGLGQIYVGYYHRGFIHAIVVASIMTFLISADIAELLPLGVIFLIFFWLYNIIDAGRRAAMVNHVLAGGEVSELPQDFAMPRMGGSIVGGLVLIAFGLILLSHTVWGVPLEWIENWWPLLPIFLGVYLLGKAVRERMEQSDDERDTRAG